MRKQILLSLLSLFCLCSWGQVSDDGTSATVDLTTTRLEEAIPADKTESITSLTLTSDNNTTGMTFEDAVYLHDHFANLETLDMSKMMFITDSKKEGNVEQNDLKVTVTLGGTQTRNVDLKCEFRRVPSALCYNKTKLKKVVLPTQSGWNVVAIGHSAFSCCTALEEIDLGGNANFNDLGAYSFYNCSSLKSIDFSAFGRNWNGIGQSALSNCTSLTTVTFNKDKSKGPKTIGVNAFNGCNSLKSIELPNSVTTIYNAAFSVMPNLESLILPDNKDFTTISPYCISRCGKLTTINIPASVTTIGKSAFNSTGLTSLTVNSAVPPTCDVSDKNNNPFASVRNNCFVVNFSGEAVGHEADFRNADGWNYLMSKSLSEDDGTFAGQKRDDNGGNWDHGTLAAGNGVRVYLQRTFTDGWNTLVLPFSASGEVVKKALGENVKVAKLTALGDNELTFTYVEDCSINEDEPVIVSDVTVPTDKVNVLWTGSFQDRDNFYVFDGVDIAKAHSGNTAAQLKVGNVTMKGTFKTNNAVHINNGYFLQNGNLYAAKGGVNYSVKAFRAWFEVSGNKAKNMTFKVVDGSTVTGIKTVEKAGQNKGVIYDLQGRVVKNPARGIYIQNGKKFIVK